MKKLILSLTNSILLKPVIVKHCSQTIYQALIGCLRLWDATQDDKWKKRAEKLCHIMIDIQRPDGGFDINYDFNFGMLHKKGESTAPELVSLLALVEYYKRFGGKDVEAASKRAAQWIKKHAIKIDDKKWAIPYSPYSTKEVMVYNGTSFAAGALGVYLSVFPDGELMHIYEGMNKYLYDVLSTDTDLPGKFWYYSDQSRSNLSYLQREKIDYYHQMQQVEMHVLSELELSAKYQIDIIRMASEHVAHMQNKDSVIPYLNTFTAIHLWGFCSCASGFILAAKLIKEKETEYKTKAVGILDWIVSNSWNGRYFYPIVAEDGQVVDGKFYVRSDAWVFNTLALAIKECVYSKKHIEICEVNYNKMESVGFSGIENHASNYRIRTVFKLIEIASRLKRRIWPK
nr:hypothetical protein [uncultured Flavobacterium sp.]